MIQNVTSVNEGGLAIGFDNLELSNPAVDARLCWMPIYLLLARFHLFNISS